MNHDLFTDIQQLSLDIQSKLGRQERQGVDELIDQRNALLKTWFGQINDLIQLTNDQQLFLEDLLAKEQALLDEIKAEQNVLQSELGALKGASKYQEFTE